MILFTTGHERFQFDYLMGLVPRVREAFPGEEILVQYGHSTTVPSGGGIEAVQLLPPGQFRQAVAAARVVVSHCGEGNLIVLQELGKPFVLVPRTRKRREHVDNHQVELAHVLAREGLPVAFGLDDLLATLRAPRFVRFPFRDAGIASALAARGLTGTRILLVTSSGGHFRLMQTLAGFWRSFPERLWVTFDGPTTRAELEGERAVWAHQPTNRNVPNLLRNKLLACRTLREFRPEVVLTTGAGVAVPFLLLGKWFGCRTAFVESITRVNGLSLSARLLRSARALDTLVVQHGELGRRCPEAVFVQ